MKRLLRLCGAFCWAMLIAASITALPISAVHAQEAQIPGQHAPDQEVPNYAPLDSPVSNTINFGAIGPNGPAPRVEDARTFTTKQGLQGWRVVIPGDRPLPTPAVIDGKVFIGGGFGSYEFYCFDARSGKKHWMYRTGDDGPTAAVVSDGYVAFNTESCEIEIITMEGKPVWKKWLGDPLMSMPAISKGKVYMAYPNSKGDNKHYLACFDLKNGREYWKNPIHGEIITAPTIYGDHVFLTTLDGTLYCYRAPTGRLVWTERKNATSSPAVFNGKCFFGQRKIAKLRDAKGKAIDQQMEQIARRSVAVDGEVLTLDGTAQKADYLDSLKRAKHSTYTMANAGFDSKVGFGGAGFSGGGISSTINTAKSNPISADKNTIEVGELGNPGFAPAGAGLGGGAFAPGGQMGLGGFTGGAPAAAKIWQAQGNLGVGTVSGVWAYQGSRPFVYKDRLYSTMGDTIKCVDIQTEKILWQREFKHENKLGLVVDCVVTPPAIVNDRLFVGTFGGDVLCLSAKDGKTIWKHNVGDKIAFQPAVANGRVYVSTVGGQLWCIPTGNLRDDGWTMWGGNAEHNGLID